MDILLPKQSLNYQHVFVINPKFVTSCYGTNAVTKEYELMANFGVPNISYKTNTAGSMSSGTFHLNVWRYALASEQMWNVASKDLSKMEQEDSQLGPRSRLSRFGRKLLQENWPINWTWIGDQAPDVINPIIANPLVLYCTQKWFNSAETQYLDQMDSYTRNNYLLVGYLGGLFDGNDREATNYRRELIPYISGKAPEVLLRLKREFPNSDSPALSHLKQFWGKVFEKYWVSASRNEDMSGGSGLSEAAVKRGSSKLQPDARHFLTRDVAEIMNLAAYSKVRAELRKELSELVGNFANRRISPQEISSVIDHRVGKMVLGKITEANWNSEQSLRKLATELRRLVDSGRERCKKLFGSNFENLPPIVQIALLSFSSFVANGAVVRGVEQGVKTIEAQLIPRLVLVHDRLQHLQTREISTSTPKPESRKFIQLANKTTKRLSALNIGDEIISSGSATVQKSLDLIRGELQKLAKSKLLSSNPGADVDDFENYTMIAVEVAGVVAAAWSGVLFGAMGRAEIGIAFQSALIAGVSIVHALRTVILPATSETYAIGVNIKAVDQK